MTTDTKTWPEQIRLPGQTAAHPGPVDMTMMYVMHHAFRRDLNAFAEAAGKTPAGDRRAWRAMAKRWATFSFALHEHHTGEDSGLWPALMDRADDAGRATLEAMEAEHAEIDPILQACAAGFARLEEHADEDARAALAVRLVAARELLGEHLRHEETEAIALIQALLTHEDWERIEEENFKKKIALRDVLRLVPWAAQGVPAQVRRDLFAKPGGFMHRVMWLLTRRRFERQDAVAFAHLA